MRSVLEHEIPARASLVARDEAVAAGDERRPEIERRLVLATPLPRQRVLDSTGLFGEELIGGSIGWQIGVQKADIILVFKTSKSIDNIAGGKITLGADMSVAAGPIGRHAEADTDLDMEAEIYSYSKSKGLFAGISLKGASIQADREANGAFYEQSNISAYDILNGRGVKAPSIVEDLKRVLVRYAGRIRRI